MTNTPDLSKMTHLERLAYFSAATPTTTMIDTPARRTPPRPRNRYRRRRTIR